VALSARSERSFGKEQIMATRTSHTISGRALQAAILLLVLAAHGIVAPATASAAGLRRVVWQAPVGHRQPNAATVPSRVQKDEGKRTQGQVKFDDSLTICRGC
jgi:hypothetical protein